MKNISKWFFIFSVVLVGGSFTPRLHAAEEAAEERKENADENTCPVCSQEDMGAGISNNARVELACKHSLCGTCFQSWIVRNATCPMCRAAIAVSSDVAELGDPAVREQLARVRIERNIKKTVNKYVLFNTITRLGVLAGFYKNKDFFNRGSLLYAISFIKFVWQGGPLLEHVWDRAFNPHSYLAIALLELCRNQVNKLPEDMAKKIQAPIKVFTLLLAMVDGINLVDCIQKYRSLR